MAEHVAAELNHTPLRKAE